jgi:adenylate cyclase
MAKEKTIFKTEERVIHKAEAILADEQFRDDPLLDDFTALLKSYKKMYRRIQRLVKLGDTQQLNILEKALKQQKDLTNAYSRFVPPEYLQFLQKGSITEVRLGDHVSREMPMMFCDLRSFTTISETMTPQENFNFVNAYLKRVSPIIRDHHGIIVKYLGDGLMAVFPDDVNDAVQAAISMLREVQTYNTKRTQENYLPIEVGFGIHVGHMMVGIVGEKSRMEADAISDNVNLTSRLEGLTKYYQVSLLISGEAYELIDPSRYHIRFLDNVAVKGRNQPIAAYEVFDADPEELREQKLWAMSEYEKAQRLYFSKKFADAAKRFINVLEILPNDATTKLYLERSAKFMVEGVSDDWDGVRVMAEK